MLTPEQAFRVGFLARCSEEGLHGAALDERLDAAAAFAKTGGFVEDMKNLVTLPINVGARAGGMALLTGAVGGAGIGTGLGLLSAPEDPGKIKPPPFLQGVQRSEYAAALRQQAAELKRLREGQMNAPRPTRSHYGI